MSFVGNDFQKLTYKFLASVVGFLHFSSQIFVNHILFLRCVHSNDQGNFVD